MQTTFLRLAVTPLLVGWLGATTGTAAEPWKLTKVSEFAGAHAGVLSPDGKTVAASLQEPFQKKLANGTAFNTFITRTKLLDAGTGKEVALIPGAQPVEFSSTGKVLAVKQSFDEQFIKAGQFTQRLNVPMPQLWDAGNPAKPKQLFVVDGATDPKLSPGGKFLAVAAAAEEKFGNAGKAVVGLPKLGNKGGVAVPPIGAMGAGLGGSVLTPQFVELWEVDSARLHARYVPGPKNQSFMSHPFFSPDGKHLAVLVNRGNGHRIALFDIEKKKEARLIECEGFLVQSVHRDAPPIAGQNGVALPTNMFQLFGSSEPMIDFSPVRSLSSGEGYVLAAVLQGKDGVELNLWNPTTGERLATLLREKNDEHVAPQIEFCFSPDGKTLAVILTKWKAAVNGPAVVPPGRKVFAPAVPLRPGGSPAPGIGAVPPIAFPMAGREIVSAEVTLWDVDMRTKKLTLKVAAHTARFASDSVLATIASDNKQSKLQLWDVATGQELAALDDCQAVQFSADGRTMLTRGSDGKGPVLRVWKVESATNGK